MTTPQMWTLTFACVAIVIQVDPELFRAHVARLLEAWRLANISVEKASYRMAIDRRQLQRQLDAPDGGHLSLTRMFVLPAEVFRWWAVLLIRDLGWPTAFAPVVKMIKMELPSVPVSERERA